MASMFPTPGRRAETAPAASPGTRRAAWRQTAGVAVFVVLLAVLNVASLQRHVLSLTGWERDVADAGLEVLEPLSEVPGVGALRSMAERVRERVDGSAGVQLVEGDTTQVVFAGDSVLDSIADELAVGLADTVGAGSVELIELGSALGVPELWDWEAEIDKAVRAHQADVVFVMLDARPQTDGRVPIGDPADPRWVEQWRAQTAAFTVAALDAGAGQVVWLERPYTSDVAYEAAHGQRSQVLRDLAASDSRVVFVEAASALSGTTGEHAAYVTVDGRRVRAADPDGVHLTDVGAQLYAREVLSRLGLGR